jgi:hypothetical protein
MSMPVSPITLMALALTLDAGIVPAEKTWFLLSKD